MSETMPRFYARILLSSIAVCPPKRSSPKRSLPQGMAASLAFFLVALALLWGGALGIARAEEESLLSTERYEIRARTVLEDLEFPWGMAFLPDGSMLITERPGRLRLFLRERQTAEPVEGVPQVTRFGQGGLMDVALHPNFAENGWLYLSLAVRVKGKIGTEVVRGRLRKQGRRLRLEDVETVFRALPKASGGRHFGSRLLFSPEGRLFITLGDRGQRPWAQQRDKHPGSVIRITPEGAVPPDNPFPDGARPEIYSYGNRNVQGICHQAATGITWIHEHGPQGGDELNRLRAGVNYGWPEITYGVNYVIGTAIGRGHSAPGMEQPAHYWVPSIAPSGMACYDGEIFPQWQGNLFIGSLKFAQLVRLELENGRVVHEERMLDGAFGRIRDVRQGPDGHLYLLIDSPRGRLVRLERVASP